MAEIAATLGLPAEWRFKGETYRVWSSDYEVRGMFERWLESKALTAIEAHRERLGVAAYALQMETWLRDCATGTYNYSGLNAWQARQNEDGRAQLLALRLSKGQPRMALSDLRMLVEEARADDPEAFAALEKAAEAADADPNRPRPWRRAAPGQN